MNPTLYFPDDKKFLNIKKSQMNYECQNFSIEMFMMTLLKSVKNTLFLKSTFSARLGT